MTYGPRSTAKLVKAAQKAYRLAGTTNHQELIVLTRLIADEMPKVDRLYDGAASLVRLGIDSETVQRKLAEIAADDYL